MLVDNFFLWQLRVWEGPRSGFISAPVMPGYGRDQPRSHVYSCWLCLGDVPQSSPGSLLWEHQRPFFYVLISPVMPPYSSLKGKSHKVWVNTVANSTWLKTCLLWKGGVLIEQTKGCWWSDPLKKDKDYFFNISIYTHSIAFPSIAVTLTISLLSFPSVHTKQQVLLSWEIFNVSSLFNVTKYLSILFKNKTIIF